MEPLVSVISDPQQRSAVRRELVCLLSQDSVASLKATLETFVQDDGTSSQVIALKGTVPIHFRGSTYHIPLDVYLSPAYPSTPPTCFVRPCSNMLVQSGHPCVDHNGHVKHPWGPTSSLAQLIASLSDSFSRDPPLYSVPSSEQRNLAMSNLGAKSQPSVVPKSGEEQNRELVREKVNLRYGRYLVAMDKECGELLARQRELEGRGRDVDEYVNRLAPERLARDQTWAEELNRAADEECRQEENLRHEGDHDAPTLASSIDEVVRPTDPLSRQFLTCVATDAALEDCMFVLSRRVTAGRSDATLREIRALAREQFLARATAIKISNMFHPLPPYPPPPPPSGLATPPPSF